MRCLERNGLARALACGLLLLAGGPAAAGQAAVAAASNFGATLAVLSAEFERATGHRLRVSLGSTGKLYAQVVNGAPFDVLLAADRERPERLERDGLGVAGSRYTYAIGALVLWSRDPALAGRDCRDALRPDMPGRLAIANPDTAPYGAAAREYLERAGLWDTVRPRLAYGENIAQTLQFAASGSAVAGFVAAAQVTDPGLPAASCRYELPPDSHAPLEQQALLLAHGAREPAAVAFLEFLRSPAARTLIAAAGYRLPAP